jgi:adenylylsulfate kinase
MSKNVVKQEYRIEKKDRNDLNNHASFLVWFTGLSGSGKSTIANELENKLHQESIRTYSIDGDNIRTGLNKDLSFSPEDRKENIRRIAEVSKLMVDAGILTIAAFISPYEKDRENIRSIVGSENYIEVYVSTPIETCESRDVKGLYAKARSGEIPSFTGISAPYEQPKNAHITINTDETSLENAVIKIYSFIEKKLNRK